MSRGERTKVTRVTREPRKRATIDDASRDADDRTKSFYVHVVGVRDARDGLLDDGDEPFPYAALMRRVRRDKLPIDAGRVTPAERVLPLGDHGAEQVVGPNQVRALITHEALERGIESMESLKSIYKSICLKILDNFQMNCSDA